MKKIPFLLALTSFAGSVLLAQVPAIQWQKTIGGSEYDYIHAVQETADGGYILGGTSYSSISGNKTENNKGMEDYWVVKLDASRTIQWQKTIGGDSHDELLSLHQTADGGYIIAGGSNSSISGDKTEDSSVDPAYWVVKLDTLGNIQWQKTVSNETGFFCDIQPTPDGGYVFGGTINKNPSGSFNNIDYLMVKLDATGNMQWQKTIGGEGFEQLYAIRQTADGGYILGGYSNSDISGDKTENSLGNVDYWIVKLDAIGSIQWQNTIGGDNSDELRSLQLTADGGYILGGVSISDITGDKTELGLGQSDYWIVKLDATGNIEWQNTIGGNDVDDLTSVQQTIDGGYIIGGHSFSNISGDKVENSLGIGDYWLIKLNSAGDIQWQNTIGGYAEDEYPSILQTTDAGYIVAGTSATGISGDKTEKNWGVYDWWVIKLAPETVSTNELSPPQKSLEIYPNPTTGAIFVKTKVSTCVRLRNVVGQTVFTQTVRDRDAIDMSTLPNGLYFLTETATGITHKILKNK